MSRYRIWHLGSAKYWDDVTEASLYPTKLSLDTKTVLMVIDSFTSVKLSFLLMVGLRMG